LRIAIIGGGIAGLACAYELELARRAGGSVEYELFEAGSRLGGVISSAVVNGTVIERGPDSFLTEKPAAAQLCRELGLGPDLVGAAGWADVPDPDEAVAYAADAPLQPGDQGAHGVGAVASATPS